jgi:hypothetical protein
MTQNSSPVSSFHFFQQQHQHASQNDRHNHHKKKCIGTSHFLASLQRSRGMFIVNAPLFESARDLSEISEIRDQLLTGQNLKDRRARTGRHNISCTELVALPDKLLRQPDNRFERMAHYCTTIRSRHNIPIQPSGYLDRLQPI